MATTGIAAYTIHGRTINSYFNLGQYGQHTTLESMKHVTPDRRSKIINADTFIIDECFLLSENIMNKINELLKVICCDARDFGNKRFIFVGDERQLSYERDDDCCFIGSKLSKRLTILSKALPFSLDGRLTEDYYNELSYLRVDRNAKELQAFIQQLTTSPIEFNDTITVTYTNEDVTEINNERLTIFEGEKKIHNDKIYKIGMPIMLKKNDSKKGFQIHNGKICKILKYDSDLTISFDEFNKKGDLEKHERTIRGYNEWVPAFAITIHKVQGLTLKNINIYLRIKHLSYSDATRLLYVALSRVNNAKNVYIKLV